MADDDRIHDGYQGPPPSFIPRIEIEYACERFENADSYLSILFLKHDMKEALEHMNAISVEFRKLKKLLGIQEPDED